MKIRTIKYHLKEGFKGLFKNRLMSLASIITVGACAFILVTSLCIAINLDYSLEHVETTIGISVFLGDELTESQVNYLKNDISNIEHISNIEYKTKEDALEWARENWGEEMFYGIENDNPLPRAFEISLDGAKYQKDVVKSLNNLQITFERKLLNNELSFDILPENSSENITSESSTVQTTVQPTTQQITSEVTENTSSQDSMLIGSDDYKYKGIEKISHAQKESDILVTLNTMIRIISLVLIIIMCIIAIAIIMNTIKLTVYIRKNEINIMKYVGATDWFIRWPFIIEGIVIGLIGSVIPTAICWIGYNKLIDVANEKAIILQGLIQFKPSSEIFMTILPATLLLGMLLGAFGSISSIRKHLNV